jgi:hypothetical protein
MSGSIRLRSSKACLAHYNSRWAGASTVEIGVAIAATATTVTAYDLRTVAQVVKNRSCWVASSIPSPLRCERRYTDYLFFFAPPEDPEASMV